MASAVPTVDVRDMLCAQAIQVVWKAMRERPAGAVLEVVCNAADVKDDVLIWAKELRHQVVGTKEGPDETWLWIRKGTA